MKKILLLFSICLIPMLGYAQTDENGKERVYIDYFSRPGTISNILAEALRNKVIEGIQKMDRVELIDVDSNEALKTEAKRRQEASAMGDAVCRSEVMTTLGAQYLIQGNITSMQGVKKTDSKGKTYYQGSVSYTLKIVDPSNGTLKGTQTFTHEGLTGNIGDTPDEAIIKTLDYVVISMDDFVDEYFKMKGTIVQIESTKKDKAQTVYIDLGTKRGATGEPGALLAPTSGTRAASACISPSKSRVGAISFAILVASTTLSTTSCLAEPLVEKLNRATFGFSIPATAFAVCAVQIAICAS